MEYFQLIFVHEGSLDELYLRKLIDKLYPILKERGNKLTFVPMNGKTNYNKMENKTEEKRNKFEGTSIVIFIIDVDKINSNPNDAKLFNEIEEYTEKNKYKLIFMNPNIEGVLIPEKNIRNKNDKKVFARHFTWNEKMDLNKLKSDDHIKDGTSNICIILEEVKTIITVMNIIKTGN